MKPHKLHLKLVDNTLRKAEESAKTDSVNFGYSEDSGIKESVEDDSSDKRSASVIMQGNLFDVPDLVSILRSKH